MGRDVSKSLRISSHASIFTAELVALNLSLDILSDVPNVKKFAIFSHSLSSLLAINNRNLETGYMQKFITDYSQLSNSGKIIILIWIPSHIGIRGNEAAKSALNLSMSAVKCPATDLYSDVANHCQRLWQAEWDGLSQTNYTLLNLSSATVIWVISVVRMLLFSGGSASVILALPIHTCWIDKINQNVLTVTVR